MRQVASDNASAESSGSGSAAGSRRSNKEPAPAAYQDCSEMPPFPHTPYRDCSRLPPLRKKRDMLQSETSGAKEPTFPVKLHMILSNPEHEDIITWLPHGRSWRIVQQKAFEEKVIPFYFRHGRYSSFARQVNGWGFKRVMSGSDYNSYYNPLFLRGLPHLSERMRRLTTKDTTTDRHQTPPDFYTISQAHPLPENSSISLPDYQVSPIQTPPAFLATKSSAVALNSSEPEFSDRRRENLGISRKASATPSSTRTNVAATQGQSGVAAPAPSVRPQSPSFPGSESAPTPGPFAQRWTLGPEELALLPKLLDLATRLPNRLQTLLDITTILVQEHEAALQRQARAAAAAPPAPREPDPTETLVRAFLSLGGDSDVANPAMTVRNQETQSDFSASSPPLPYALTTLRYSGGSGATNLAVLGPATSAAPQWQQQQNFLLQQALQSQQPSTQFLVMALLAALGEQKKSNNPS